MAVDEAEVKRQRKEAKRAAKEVAEAEAAEAEAAEAKRQRKAAKKAAKAAAAAEEVEEVDEEEAKRQRKAAKKAAKLAAAEAEAEAEAPKKAKKETRAAKDNEEEAPPAKKSKSDARVARDAEKDLKVFIRGLPFSVDEATLRKDFEECGEIALLQFPYNEEGKPKGFAFIIYATQEGFDAAMKFDNTNYSGRTINVSQASDSGKGKGKDGGSKGEGKGGRDNTNTVFVRGLPWSVTEDALRKDFAECGEMEKLTFPLNEEGKPKGIAFVKYSASEGVEAALKFDNTDYGGRTINVSKAEDRSGGKGKDGKGKDAKGKGKDGKGKDGKGKGKKSKGPSDSFAKNTGALLQSTGEKKTFDDSDDE